MDSFELPEIVDTHSRLGQPYHEFFRASTLSLGLYVLRAGQPDPQTPHTEDEVYHVIQGKGSVRVAGEDRPVAAGSIVFVETGVEHRFHSITEDLTMLVCWAPPRRSQAASA